ncbi:hypothetical protein B0T17DRAFT_505109 [Bombardia bombarda]|uniref:Uncharacterized protein n=1 Tax=Bombardia bombarda TaxID=252184 RepID=A0AA39X772_9PEZI|nr:hypothetical protein B0T17DRAFT_505109 [Bombardia bombarda]
MSTRIQRRYTVYEIAGGCLFRLWRRVKLGKTSRRGSFIHRGDHEKKRHVSGAKQGRQVDQRQKGREEVWKSSVTDEVPAQVRMLGRSWGGAAKSQAPRADVGAAISGLSKVGGVKLAEAPAESPGACKWETPGGREDSEKKRGTRAFILSNRTGWRTVYKWKRRQREQTSPA